MNKHLRNLGNLGWMSILVVATACRSEATPSDAAEQGTGTPPTPLAVGPERPLDLATHAVLAFRPTAGGYTGGYTTHEATIRDGLVEVTPFSFSDRERHAGAPMRLETTAISMEDTVLGQLTGTRLEDGSVILERGDIDERLRNAADGLHQEWLFKAAPAGSGDLTVEVGVFGQTYTTTTANGVHLASGPGAGFVYSHAVWVSGDGTAWPIAAVHDNGRIRMTVPDSVLASTVFPAVLDPTISAEADADAPVTGPTATNSQDPAIASDGTGYLVVWEDERNSVDSDIWGTRLDAAGAILDPLGIKIASTAGKQLHPTVAFNGTSYVVAWEDGKVAGGTEADIAAAIVSTTGAVTALPAVAATGANEIEPALAGGGGTALLTWNSGGTIRGAAFGGGSFGASFAIAAAGAAPAVALAPGGNYLVVWSEGAADVADLNGQLVTATGTLSGTALTVSAGAGSQAAPAAAFDGTNYAVVWTNNSLGKITGGALTISGARVSTAGVVLDTHVEGVAVIGGTKITGVANTAAIPAEPAIACVAAGCTVLWQDRRSIATTSFDVYAQRLNPDFTANGAEIAISTAAGKQLAPVIGAAGTSFITAWIDTSSNAENTVFGETLSGAGVAGTPRTLVTGQNRESQPTIGVASKTYGLFWSDSRSDGGGIQLARYNANGSKLEAASIVAAEAANVQIDPAASSDLGGNALAVWVDTRNATSKDIFGGRFSSAGAALDGTGFAITTAAGDQLTPAVASNGTVALVAWADRRSGSSFDIFGALVSSAGAILVPDIVICNVSPGDQVRPAVTWDSVSSQFIVLWSDNRSGVSHIFGARVSSAGAVLDSLSGVAISNGAVGQFAPAIASDSAGSFAVWEDRKLGRDVFGTRMAGGSSLDVKDPDGIAISTAAGTQSTPVIASLGSSYAVIWADDRNATSDIFGQQLTTGGALSGAEFTVTSTANDELNPAISGGALGGTALIAYESRKLNTSRVETRLITSAALGGAVCSDAAKCATGFCVDGRCCDTACGNNDQTDCQACSATRSGHVDGICSPRQPSAICRTAASSFCDVRENCDGVSTACPADVGKNGGAACNLNTNVPPGTGTGVCQASAPHTCQ